MYFTGRAVWFFRVMAVAQAMWMMNPVHEFAHGVVSVGTSVEKEVGDQVDEQEDQQEKPREAHH